MKYSAKQKVLLSVYPEAFIYSKITKFAESEDKKDVVINLKRKIKNWNMYNEKSAERILVYNLAIIELSALGVCDTTLKDSKIVDGILYGFVHEFKHNGELLYVLELAVCKDFEEAKEIRTKLASLNNTIEENIWIFYFKNQVNEGINKLLYNKACFLTAINTNTYEMITHDDIPDYTEYNCLCRWATPIIFMDKEKKDGEDND
jgi:hypothetical protein